MAKRNSRGVHGPPACVVGNCRGVGTLPFGWEGDICERHAYEIWRRVEWRDAENCDTVIPYAEAREYDRADARAKRSTERRKPTSMGEIYFVKVDDLIKVGWTSKLADRVRSYGPKAELLAHYPATRADESALHRQLTPARYRGREWYSDVPAIRLFIDEALRKHGSPRFRRLEWTEPKAVTKPRRWAG